MASIQAAIQITDRVSGPILRILSSVNRTVAAFEEMQQATQAPVNMAWTESVRQDLNDASADVIRLREELERVGNTRAAPVVEPEISAPGNPGWKTDNLELFNNTGYERFQKEVEGTNRMLQELNRIQDNITNRAETMNILPENAVNDIAALQDRVQELQSSIEETEQNRISVGTDEANDQAERLRIRLSGILDLQENLNSAMQEADIGKINNAYLQLSRSVSSAQREIRDSFQEPITIPVTWETDGFEMFTGTGIDRFRQEVQSANGMLEQLSGTQNAIAQQAYRTNLFPPEMFQDLNRLTVRIDAVRSRIQAIESNPINIGTDTANAELERLRGQLAQAVQEQQELNTAMGQMDVSAANAAYLRLSGTIADTEQYLRDNVSEQGNFNRAIQEGESHAGGLFQMIRNTVAAYAGMQGIRSAINLSDQMTSTNARLNLIVDDGGSVDELQDKIYASAQRARGSYQGTADAVAKLGLMAGDAFGSNDEIIAFSELLNKQFAIAGTEAAGIDAAMLQLTQAMGSGVLRGEEYNSILEQAPNIIQSIASYMGVTTGELKDLASEGVITAEIVKNAMFASADEINDKFNSMPMTFSQIWTSFQNSAYMAFQPVLTRLNEIANSDAFQTFVNGAAGALSTVAGIVLDIFNLVASVGGFIGENWSIIQPIIMGIVTALGLYYGAMLLYNTITGIATAITTAKSFAEQVHAASLMMGTGATFAATAAQYGLNAALYACPIVWIIALIVALIAIFYAVIGAINKVAGTSISATGLIAGAFTWLLSVIANIFITLWNTVVDVFALIYNLIATVANFIGNVFFDPVGAVVRLFVDLADTVLGVLQTLASAIDTIFGSNLSASVQGWRDSINEWANTKFGEEIEVMARMNPEGLKLDRIDNSEAFQFGYDWGAEKAASLSDSIKGLFGLGDNGTGLDDTMNDPTYSWDAMTDSIQGIGTDTAAIRDSVEITSEDLKYLRDIADRESVNRFTTAEIKVDMKNTNQIGSNMDIDGVINRFGEKLDETLAASAAAAER